MNHELESNQLKNEGIEKTRSLREEEEEGGGEGVVSSTSE